MDIITKAITEVKFRIPYEVLRLAYQTTALNMAPVSLDEQIRRKTINARVIVDANIVGGDTIIVDLSGLAPKQYDNYNYVFEIPPERLNHRTIMSALSVNYMTYNSVVNTYLPGANPSTPNRMNDLTSAAHRAMDSRSSIPIVSNAEVLVVGPRTIMIRNHLITASVVQVRCVVTHEENLSNINIRNAHSFSKLCELAVKSFIYKELVIRLDRGYLEGGQELGSIKSYVDTLSDSEQMYQDYLREEWTAVSVMNDRNLYENLLKMQIDPSL